MDTEKTYDHPQITIKKERSCKGFPKDIYHTGEINSSNLEKIQRIRGVCLIFNRDFFCFFSLRKDSPDTSVAILLSLTAIPTRTDWLL